MALIKCPDCGKMFSEYAECCPECGCPTEDAKAVNMVDYSPSQRIEEGRTTILTGTESSDSNDFGGTDLLNVAKDDVEQPSLLKEDNVVKGKESNHNKSRRGRAILCILTAIAAVVIIGAYFLSRGKGTITNSSESAITEEEPSRITSELAEAIAQYGINESFAEFHNGLLLVEGVDGYGYIDRAGKEVIPCKYYLAEPFSEGIACVCCEGWSGLIDTLGHKVVAVDGKDKRVTFSEGMYFITDYENGTTYLSNNGKKIPLPPNSPFQHKDFSEGVAAIENYSDEYGYKSRGKWGFINRDGKMIVPFQYDDVLSFSEGLAAVCYGFREWGYINKEGETVIPIRYKEAESFSEGLAAVCNQYGEREYINTKGETVLNLGKLYRAGSFHDGMALIARKEECYGFINKSGEEIISCQYEETDNFHEGLARVCIGGKWGYVNKSGEIVIPCRYDAAQNFSEGLAVVLFSEGRWGIVDKKGRSTLDYSLESSADMDRNILVERAKYIFEKIPDINRTIFSEDFYNVVKEAIDIADKWGAEGDLCGDGIYYWYSGQDGGEKDGLIGVYVKEKSKTKAIAVAQYREWYSVKLHKMSLICENGSWVLDDWDGRKEGIRKETKDLVESYESYMKEQENNVPDHFESFEDVAAYLSHYNFVSSDGNVASFNEDGHLFIIDGERYPYVFEGLDNDMVASFVVKNESMNQQAGLNLQYKLHVNLREKEVTVLDVSFYETPKYDSSRSVDHIDDEM